MKHTIPARLETILAMLVLVLLMCLRLPHIDAPPAEAGEYWRQPDTYSMIINFCNDRFNPLYPQLNYDGLKPNYVELEFPVYTFTAAVLFRVFGETVLIPRLMSALAFGLSAFYLYLLARKYLSFSTSLIAMVFYCVTPLALFYSRTVMPDSSMMLFLIAGYYYFVCWYEGGDGFYSSAILLSLGVLTKPPVAFIGLALLVLSIKKYGAAFIRQKKLWLYAAIVLLPWILWLVWGRFTAEFHIASLIGTKHLLRKGFVGFFVPENWEIISARMQDCLGLPLLCFAIVGLAGFNKKLPLPIAMFIISLVLEMVTIMGAITLDNYLYPVTPALALLGALAFQPKHDGSRLDNGIRCGVAVAACTFALVFAIDLSSPKFDTSSVQRCFDGAEILMSNTEKGDVIVIGSLDPAVLALSDRDGYRANIAYYDFIPTEPALELEYFIEHGADYFYTYYGYIYNDSGGDYLSLLEEKYPKTELGGGHVIYDLREVKDAQ